MKPLRFLFFLYYYPPFQATASKRNHQISGELSSKSGYAKVFTVSHKPEDNGVTHSSGITTVASFDYRYFLRKKTGNGALPEEKKKSWFRQAMIRLINSYPLSILIGEGGLKYMRYLVKHGQKVIHQHGVTHIYSSFRPFADHYAAYILKKRNPDLIWIADFRDLIIDPHYQHIVLPAFHHRVFKNIFRRADVLTTVSDGLARELKYYNPNVITVRNGIKHIPEHIDEVHCKYFKIVYTGSMFLDKRNPEPVLSAIVELISNNLMVRSDVRLIYAGKDSHTWGTMIDKYSLGTIFIDKGLVSQEESFHLQYNASINLLLTISSDQLTGVLTGKMIEYFEAGSPVLGIVVNKNDPELSEILAELEIGKSFSDHKQDMDQIKNFILAEYHHWKRMGTNRKPVRLDVLQEKYSVSVTMQPLFEQLGIQTITSPVNE